MDLVLSNLQRLICHKTQQTKPNHRYKTWLTNSKNQNTVSKNSKLQSSGEDLVLELSECRLPFHYLIPWFILIRFGFFV